MTIDMSKWGDKQVEVADELGFDEIERRVDRLENYYRYNTVALIYNNMPLTPEQAIAWAKFAQSLGKEHVINGTNIQFPKTFDELALIVVDNEIYKRKQAENA